MSRRWSPTVTGEQTVTLTFTVGYEVTGDCYYDAGRIYGPPEHCYPPEGECEITKITHTITDDNGTEIQPDSNLGKLILAALDDDELLEKLMETDPNDWRTWK